MSEEFIGSGWGFPLRTDATGRIALSASDRHALGAAADRFPLLS